MAPLRFSANVSWLFPELPGLAARLRAAGRSGFKAAEVGWPYTEPPEVLARAAREAGLQLVLINTPPGARWGPGQGSGGGGSTQRLRPVLSAGDREKGEMGLGAVPGRQAAFREGLEQAVLYAKALGCPRYRILSSPSMTQRLFRTWFGVQEKRTPGVEKLRSLSAPALLHPSSPGPL